MTVSLKPPKENVDAYVMRLHAWRDLIVTLLGLILVCGSIITLAIMRIIPTDVVSSLLTAIAVWLVRDNGKGKTK